MSLIRDRVISSLDSAYLNAISEFCKGQRFRPSNDAYFRVLRAIATFGESSVDLPSLAQKHPNLRQTINNIKDRRLHILLQGKPLASTYFFYNRDTKNFMVEDPAVLYFLRHLDWEAFRKKCGFRAEGIDEFKWELGISFAGTERWLAEYIFSQLELADVNIFYDRDQELNLLGKNLSEEFRRIFAEEIRIVLVIISQDYATRDWTRFEREVFKDRVKHGQVIPIILSSTPIQGLSEEILGFRIQDLASRPDGWEDKVRERVIDPLFKLVS